MAFKSPLERQKASPMEVAASVRDFLIRLSGEVEKRKERKEDSDAFIKDELSRLSDDQLTELEERLKRGEAPAELSKVLSSTEIAELRQIAAERRDELKRELTPEKPKESPPMEASPSASPEEKKTFGEKAKERVGKLMDWTKDKGGDAKEWAKDHPYAAIGIAATATLGLYGLWKLWKSRNTTEKGHAETGGKSGWMKYLLYVPVVGLAGYAIYEGVKWVRANLENLTLGSVQKKMAELEERAKHLFDRAVKSREGEKYGISEETYRNAESVYRASRKKPDAVALRKLFGLPESATSDKFEAFMKAMAEKYDVIIENGITYARADAAMQNYEDDVRASLMQLEQWVTAHEMELGLVALVAWKTNLISIRGILRTGASTAEALAVKAASIAESLGSIAVRHPLRTLFGFAAALLAQRTVVAASKNSYLPLDFAEIGKTLAGGGAPVLGASLPDGVSQALQDGAEDLATLTDSLSAWTGRQLADLWNFMTNKVPEGMVLKNWQTVAEMHGHTCDSLKLELELRHSQSLKAGDGKAKNYLQAIAEIEVFKRSYLAHRCEHVSESDEPALALKRLRGILTVLEIETVDEAGLVRWKAADGTLVDLCVDPRIRDPKTIHSLSLTLHTAQGQSGVSYALYRGLVHLREKMNSAMERGEIAVENKFAAMAAGGSVYFFSLENQNEFWVAPLVLAKDLCPGTTWEEAGVDYLETSVNAFLVSLSYATLARVKRLIVGGQILPGKSSLLEFGWAANPLTAPLRLVRETARGMIDISIARNLPGLVGESGRLANILFGKAGIRPEWIGIVENSTDPKELLYVARQMHVTEVEGKTLAEMQVLLRKRILDSLKNIDWHPLRELFSKSKIGNYHDLYTAIGLWYGQRSALIVKAEKVAKAADMTMDAVRIAWRHVYDAVAVVLKETPGITLDQMKNVLSKVRIPSSVLEALAQSKEAVRMLVVAARDGGSVAVELLLQNGAFIALLRRTGVAKAAEVGVDVAQIGLRKFFDTVALVLKDEAGGISLDEMEKLLSKVHIPPSVLEAFAKSKGAVSMLIKAAKNGGVAAVEYIVKLATIAKRIAPVAGKAALGLDALICIVEVTMNRMRIASTDNKDLKELYALQDRISVANGVAGTAMGVTWFAVGWAPASTAWYAVGASTFAPAVVAFAAGKYVHGKAEEVAETWLSDEKDWAKKKPGELRMKLEELAPGRRTYWQGWAGGTRAENWGRWASMSREDFRKWEEGNEQTIQDANATARYKVVRAYAAKMADMPQQEGESEEAYSARFARFQQDQIGYLGQSTFGKFDTALIGEFQSAHAHAELMELSRGLKARNGSQMITVQKGDQNGAIVEREFDLARYADFQNPNTAIDGIRSLEVITAYYEQKDAITVMQVAALREVSPDDKKSAAFQDILLQQSLLREVRYYLSICDRNIRNYENVTGLPGWEWSGGLDKARNLARYGVAVELRSRIRDEARLLRAKADLTAADFAEAKQSIAALLADPASFKKYYDIGLAHGGAGSELPEDPEAVLAYPWLLGHLYAETAE